MKSELKQAWVAALRSGEYRQANRVLCDNDNRFCCLGVLCEISGLPKQDDVGKLGRSFIDSRGNLMLHLPSMTQFAEWELDPTATQTYWHMNDNGVSFDMIADQIEADALI